MACFKPLTAYQTTDGSIVWYESKKFDVAKTLTLPCGQCVGCRLERSRQWACRCMHEASLYKHNSFITLTYDDDHLPSDRSLHYEDFQKFMKRLRRRFKGLELGKNPELKEPYPIRFYMAGEYGEQYGRPHYHACIFNFDFPDKTLWKRTPAGSKIYRSKSLEELWPFGYSSIGDVNFQSAAYVARYIMKKITGKEADNYYESTNMETGEIVNLRPEFNKMSLKPGIGFDWFNTFKDDVYPHDYVVINGKKVKPPKFYDRKFSDEFPLEMEEIRHHRYIDALKRQADNTPDRLAVREIVARSKLSKLPRTID